MSGKASGRRPRADALRNREGLIDAAKAAFAEIGPEVSLEEIARRAGVGIGTLYRHFPARDDIIAAVYRREVDQLGDAATALLAENPPLEALGAWLKLAIDYLSTKKLIVPALGTMTGGSAALVAHSGSRLIGAVNEMVNAARQAGVLRAGVEPNDLMQALAALAYNTGAPGWRESAERVADIIVAGLRA